MPCLWASYEVIFQFTIRLQGIKNMCPCAWNFGSLCSPLNLSTLLWYAYLCIFPKAFWDVRMKDSPCSSLLSVTVINIRTKQLGQESVSFIFKVVISHWGKPRQELRAGSWRLELKGRNNAHWLLLRLTFSYLFYTAQAHLHRGSTFHSELSPPTPISIQKNAPTDMLTSKFDGDNSSLRSFFPVDSRFCQQLKLTTAVF